MSNPTPASTPHTNSPWGSELLRHSPSILGGEVLEEVFTFWGGVGVQEERQPLYLTLYTRVFDGLLQVALAHEAPGSYDITDHLHYDRTS